MGRVFYGNKKLIPIGLIAKAPVVEYKGNKVASLKEVTVPVKLDWDINKVTIGVVLKHPDAKLPVKKPGNIGIDLACVEDSSFIWHEHYKPSKVDGTPVLERIFGKWLEAGERYLFSTGVHLNIPAGWAVEFGDRSGHAAKYGLTILAGKIDSSYTGELKVIVLNTSKEPIFISPGERICQMIVTKDWDSQFVLSDSLQDSERGDKGFGSSGR